MTSDDLLHELSRRGYEVKYDTVVTVFLNPEKQDPELLRSVITEDIGWNGSYGIHYTSRPNWWDEEVTDRLGDDLQEGRDATYVHEIKNHVAARDGTLIGGCSVREQCTGRNNRKDIGSSAYGTIPGQMSIFDYLPVPADSY